VVNTWGAQFIVDAAHHCTDKRDLGIKLSCVPEVMVFDYSAVLGKVEPGSSFYLYLSVF
jgi:hypothetical protein